MAGQSIETSRRVGGGGVLSRWESSFVDAHHLPALSLCIVDGILVCKTYGGKRCLAEDSGLLPPYYRYSHLLCRLFIWRSYSARVHATGRLLLVSLSLSLPVHFHVTPSVRLRQVVYAGCLVYRWRYRTSVWRRVVQEGSGSCTVLHQTHPLDRY